MIYQTGDYACYLRKSRADLEAESHGEGETLARHEKILNELARHMKFNIVKTYREIVSGESIAARPAMQELLTDIEKGCFAGVFVMEVERLARGDTIDQGIVSRTFQVTGTKIITPTKTYDPLNDFDTEYFEFGLFMSRREYKTITRRINQGRIASVKEGRYISSVAPYGYQRVKIPNDKGYTLSPLHPECDIIQLIYNLYVNGKDGEEYGANKIALYLDSIGAKTRSGKRWSPPTIRDILKNEVYTGKIVWQKRKEIKVLENGNVKKVRPTAADYICVDGLHPALVSDELFDRVQKIMKNNIRTSVNSNKVLKNPLAGIVYCAKCGSLLTRLGANGHTKYSVLKCPNPYCDNVSVPIDIVEETLVNFLKNWITDYELSLNNNMLQNPPNNADAISASISTLEKEIDGLKKQLTKAYDMLEQGVYTTEVFVSRNKTLSQKINLLNTQMDALKEKLIHEQEQEAAKTELIPKAVSIIDSYYDAHSAAERNLMLKLLVDKATLLKTERNTRGHSDNRNFTLNVYPKLPE